MAVTVYMQLRIFRRRPVAKQQEKSQSGSNLKPSSQNIVTIPIIIVILIMIIILVIIIMVVIIIVIVIMVIIILIINMIRICLVTMII